MLVLLYMNFAIATVLAIFCILHQLGILIFSYNSFYKSFFGKNLIFKIDGLNNLIDKLNREKTFSTNKVKKYGDDSVYYFYIRKMYNSSFSEMLLNIRIIIRVGEYSYIILNTDSIYKYFILSFFSLIYFFFAMAFLDLFTINNSFILLIVIVVVIDCCILFFLLKKINKIENELIVKYKEIMDIAGAGAVPITSQF